MRSQAIVMTPARLRRLVPGRAARRRRRRRRGGTRLRALFTGANGCGACHTFSRRQARTARSARARPPEGGRGEGGQAARGLHQAVDRRSGRVHHAGLSPRARCPRAAASSSQRDQLDQLVQYLAAHERPKINDDRHRPRPRTARTTHHAPPPPPTGWHRFTAPGWLRVALGHAALRRSSGSACRA